MMKIIFALLFALNILLNAQPYTIVISFDGFRWDYLNRGVTPNLTKMKNDGSSALSLRPSYPSKTFPNHISILTGMYPEHHGIIANSFSDPLTGEWYKISDTIANSNSKWYNGEFFWETANKNNIITASFFWPGSAIKKDMRHPTYYKIYQHTLKYETRIDTIISWLQKPYKQRPKFLTLYFDHTDTWGHNYGPNSKEILVSIAHLDSMAGILNNKIKQIGLADSVNLIFVSDHGMTEISADKIVNIDNVLKGLNYHMEGSEPFGLIEPSQKDSVEIFNRLKQNAFHYQFYTKKTIPNRFHFNNSKFIRSFILVADLGWSITNNKWLKNKYVSKGNHGYDNNHTDMHGIFLAKGPSFKKGYQTGTLWNVDIYPLLCKIFGIAVPDSIDGDLERIEQILK